MKVGDIELAESNIFPEWDDVVKFVVSKAPLLLGAVIIVLVGFVLSGVSDGGAGAGAGGGVQRGI